MYSFSLWTRSLLKKNTSTNGAIDSLICCSQRADDVLKKMIMSGHESVQWEKLGLNINKCRFYFSLFNVIFRFSFGFRFLDLGLKLFLTMRKHIITMLIFWKTLEGTRKQYFTTRLPWSEFTFWSMSDFSVLCQYTYLFPIKSSLSPESIIREIKQSKMTTATRTPPNKRLNEQNTGCALALYM